MHFSPRVRAVLISSSVGRLFVKVGFLRGEFFLPLFGVLVAEPKASDRNGAELLTAGVGTLKRCSIWGIAHARPRFGLRREVHSTLVQGVVLVAAFISLV